MMLWSGADRRNNRAARLVGVSSGDASAVKAGPTVSRSPDKTWRIIQPVQCEW